MEINQGGGEIRTNFEENLLETSFYFGMKFENVNFVN